MRFGLFGGVARAPGETSDSGAYRRFIDYVTEAEQLGFESVFLVEHHFTGGGQLSASLSLLSHLAGLTSVMRLGTAVTVMPWHHPLLLAEQAALVDVVSNGRLDFGVGRGYRPNEFHGFGVSPAEAQARYEEALELVVRSWTSAERFSHRGRFWSFDDVIVEPKPVQNAPTPPIWVAAGSEGSLRQAARHGQGVLLDQFGSTAKTAQRIAWYQEGRVDAGASKRRGQVALTRGLLLIDHPSKRADEIARRHAAVAQLTASAQIPGREAEPQPGGPFALDTTDEATEEATIIGTPDECVRRLQALEAAGVDYVLLNDPWGGIERLRFFAREVMPSFSPAGMAA